MTFTKSFLSILALGTFLFLPAFAADEPEAKPTCCAKKAYCCQIKARCCGKTLVAETLVAEILTLDADDEPEVGDAIAANTCCAKHAYCCQIKARCCGKKAKRSLR